MYDYSVSISMIQSNGIIKLQSVYQTIQCWFIFNIYLCFIYFMIIMGRLQQINPMESSNENVFDVLMDWSNGLRDEHAD